MQKLSIHLNGCSLETNKCGSLGHNNLVTRSQPFADTSAGTLPHVSFPSESLVQVPSEESQLYHDFAFKGEITLNVCVSRVKTLTQKR